MISAREVRHVDLRPWWPWLLTAAAYPVAGVLGRAVAGRIDNALSAALAGIAGGALIGAVQWALLRRRGVASIWIAGTAAGLGVGLTAGAALVGYDTNELALVVMGALSGLGVGIGQALTVAPTARRVALWGGATAALYAIGWIVTDLVIGDFVDDQWSIFGSSGAITVALLQSTIVGLLVPAVTSSRRTRKVAS